MKLKGRRFDDVDTIKMNTTRELNMLSREDFKRCFQKWQERWDKCILSAGATLKGTISV
jgi:hypothetical protein